VCVVLVIEFVQLVSSHANELCEKENKKVISPEHILQSLEELGFGGEWMHALSSDTHSQTYALW